MSYEQQLAVIEAIRGGPVEWAEEPGPPSNPFRIPAVSETTLITARVPGRNRPMQRVVLKGDEQGGRSMIAMHLYLEVISAEALRLRVLDVLDPAKVVTLAAYTAEHGAYVRGS